MGEYSKIELALLEKFTEAIDNLIESKTYSETDKDKMMFASCVNEEEKNDFTKSQIKKMQKKLAKCSTDIAEFLRCYINLSEFDMAGDSIDDYRKRLVRNFLSGEINDVLDVLKLKFKTLKSIEEIYFSYWEEIIEDGEYGIDNKFMNHFIKYMALAERLNTFKSLLKYQNEETKSEETNEIYDLLDTIRTKDHTDLQLYDIVKERTQLNKDALQYLYKDIEVYLFGEKDDFECKYSEDETEQAIEDLKAKGHSEDDLIMLGYIRKSKAFNVATNDMDLDFTYINKEKIFFPLEFFPIYQLQGLINAELSKIKEKEELLNPDIKITPKLKTDLSVPQLSLVFKMINDLKPTIFNTKSDAELFRFISANFQTKKSTEKGISTQKLRNEFNNPDLKAIEFWEKHLHTMLSNIRKLK
jgi:oligoribonuclease (3'-5' exoribonuclease)